MVYQKMVLFVSGQTMKKLIVGFCLLLCMSCTTSDVHRFVDTLDRTFPTYHERGPYVPTPHPLDVPTHRRPYTPPQNNHTGPITLEPLDVTHPDNRYEWPTRDATTPASNYTHTTPDVQPRPTIRPRLPLPVDDGGTFPPIDWPTLLGAVVGALGTYTVGHRFGAVRAIVDGLKGKPKPNGGK